MTFDPAQSVYQRELSFQDPRYETLRHEFSVADGKLWRRLQWARGQSTLSHQSSVRACERVETVAEDSYDKAWLRMAEWPEVTGKSSITCVDLFSGCGGLSLGLWEAARACGFGMRSVCAADTDRTALDAYNQNFSPALNINSPIETVIDGEIGSRRTSSERRFLKGLSGLDFLIGGPPCQGHSDLNNHTRRDDPRNALILRQVRMAELLEPRVVVVENVRGIRRDKTGSYSLAKESLASLGYDVSELMIAAEEVGVPQSRRRNFLLATKQRLPEPIDFLQPHASSPRSFSWACADLEDIDSDSVFDSPATHSETNQRRIDFLFDNDLTELPDDQRPDCHRLKPHSYKSVYGRMLWNKPAPTITTGFGSTGQGRFVHPTKRRTVTPHEAARLQFFPDFYSFPEVGRRSLQKLIGNAVPPKLSYVIFSKLI